MKIAFSKMHGLGNDFVIIDARAVEMPQLTGQTICALADRKTGIGFDQLIRLEPAADNAREADFTMRIFNADGGEVEACGNASRAVAVLHGAPAKVATDGGVIALEPTNNAARVDMGVPRLEWQDIPLADPMDTLSMPVGWEDLQHPTAVNVGNPHVIFFVEDANAIDLERHGPVIETDPLFPDRVNVNVASVGEDSITLRVWERGVGLTRACGTGACATAVAAIRRRLVPSPVSVHLPGGTLEIEWDGKGPVIMSGPATHSFSGSFELSDFT